MSERTFGNITVVFPDSAAPSEQAGRLDESQQQDVLKAWDGAAHAAVTTAAVMAGHPDRFVVRGVTAASLEAAGRAVDEIDAVVTNLEAALLVFKQERLLRRGEAHEALLRVNRYMNSVESDDPALRQLTPDLNAYVKRG